jgi:hypothetical protein
VIQALVIILLLAFDRIGWRSHDAPSPASLPDAELVRRIRDV